MKHTERFTVPGIGTITIVQGSVPGFRFESETPVKVQVGLGDKGITLMATTIELGLDGEAAAPQLVAPEEAARRARMLSEASGVGTPGLGEHVARYVDGKIVAIDRTGEWRAVFTAPAAMDAWATAHGVSWS